MIRLALAVLLLGACADDEVSTLTGSLANACDLSFTSVRARLYDESTLSVEYVGADDQTTIRATRDIYAGPETTEITSATCELPPVQDARLTVTAFEATEGAPVAGTLTGQFAADSGVLSLVGDFFTTLTIVPLSPDT